MLSGGRRLPDLEDTIVALASAAGPGARAIIRLSGKAAAQVTQAVIPNFDCNRTAGRQWRQEAIILPGIHAPLPAEVCWWPAPRTYTGQDLVEIHTISCPPLVQRVVAECQNAGARAAQPGEFTMRAFLAGKLDLTRAEAVRGVIEAESPEQLKEALNQMAGGLAHPLHDLREELLNLLADVEAGLDFADEDIQFVDRTTLLQRITKGLAFITLIRKQMEQRALGHRPFRVVIAGRPNAGKSSLFNALVGQNRALVSDIAGTTRDWLEATLAIDGVKVQLVDTAGSGVADGTIGRQAQASGAEQAKQADLILWCWPPGERVEPKRFHCAALHLATKSDLGSTHAGLFAVSAVTGAGLDKLKKALLEFAKTGTGDALPASLSRCRHHVDACLKQLREGHRLVLDEEPAELLALSLRLALEELGAIVGAVYTDDLLDRVFSRFCIGK